MKNLLLHMNRFCDTKRILFALYGLLVISTTALAEELPFTHFTPEDTQQNPLPSANITTSFQDNSGYIWLATSSAGLLRYDGYDFTHYTKQNGLIALTVYDMKQDHLGRLWVATAAGLSVSERPLDQYISSKDINFVNHINDIPLFNRAVTTGLLINDPEGNILVGTRSHGILHYTFNHPTQIISHFLATDIFQPGQQAEITAMAQGPENLWVAVGDTRQHRLLTFPRNTRQAQVLTEIQPDSLTTALTIDTARQQLWGASHNGELWRIPLEKLKLSRETLTLPTHGTIRTLTITQAGDLWIGIPGQGLIIYSQQHSKYRQYSKKSGLLSHSVHHILEDRESNIWISQAGGLSRLPHNFMAFGHYTHRSHAGNTPALPDPAVRNIVIPQKGIAAQWIGTDEGLVAIGHDGKSAVIGNPKHKLDQQIMALCSTPQGTLWGSTPNTVFRISSDTSTPTDTTQFLSVLGETHQLTTFPRNRVSACITQPLNTDSSQRDGLWFSGQDRLFLFFNQRWFSFGKNSGLPASRLYDLSLDSQGLLWVGTDDHGLFHSRFPLSSVQLDALKKTQGPHGEHISEVFFQPGWNLSQGASSNTILGLLQHEYELWVGTANGLDILDTRQTPATLKHQLSTDNGLANNMVMSLAYDTDTLSVWAGTNNGLSEINQHSKDVLRNLSKKDGLLDNQTWWLGSLAVDKQHTIYHGSAKGLTLYRPRYDIRNLLAPIPQFREVQFTQDNNGNNRIQFAYSALSFTQEKRLLYRTRLKGYDNKWSELTTDTKIRYTNLPARFKSRHYCFEVMARNNDGIWSQTPLAYDFDIQPAWWAQWWFLLGALVLIILSGIQLNRQRLKKLSKRNHELATLNKKLTDLDKLKDQFLATTSHELRTPLHGIIGLVNALLDGASGTLPDTAQKNLSMVEASARRLANLVNDILDLSRLQQGNLEIPTGPVDFRRLAEMVLFLNRPLLSDKAIELHNHLPLDCPLVRGNADRLQQILFNLLGNAIKFTDEGSIVISASVQSSWLEVKITDTGIGIPTDKLETIFLSFEQADADNNRAYSGTGLGLSISRHLVELHGGQIRAESTPDQGSCFTFTLPLDNSGNPADNEQTSYLSRIHPQPDKVPTETSGIVVENTSVMTADNHLVCAFDREVHIMVVDDEPVNLQVVRGYLNHNNCHLTLLNDGMELLSRLQQGETPDLILLDVMLPDMDGYEVCTELRQQHPANELPVIMLTAKNQLDNLIQGFNAGANDYLSKPFLRHELIARIQAHLRVRYLSQELRHLNLSLEDKVKERTQDLAKSNEALSIEIRQREDAESELKQMAHFDQLTGLPNRTLLYGRLDHSLNLAKRNGNVVAVLFLDLDGFKPVNDTYGHHVGDLLLKAVADNLLACVREADTVARIGGDEFIVVLEEVEKLEAIDKIAQNIITHLSSGFELEGHTLYTGTSVGISLFPIDSVDIKDLIDQADAAMYQAKNSGKGQYIYHRNL
jgi:two-component system, sensor histidine kinase ChiS